MPIQVQNASRTPNKQDQNRPSPWQIIFKTISTENKVRLLKAERENQVKYKGKHMEIKADFQQKP
jgi:hypothetical protein